MGLGIRYYSVVIALTCLIVTIGLLIIDVDRGPLLVSQSDIVGIGLCFFAVSYSFVWIGGAVISFIVRLLTDNVIAILVVFFIIALNLYFIGIWIEYLEWQIGSIYTMVFGLFDSWLGRKRKSGSIS